MNRWRKLIYIILIAAGFFLLYGIQGNRQDVHFRGKSAIAWMVERWSGSGGDLSHAWIIPLVSLYMVYKKRKELAEAVDKGSYCGLGVIVFSVLLHWFGMRAQLTRVSLLSMIGLIWGIPFYLYGWGVAKKLIFPCSYLVFCIPLSFLNNITVPLRIFASRVSVWLLNGIGIETVRSGTMIYSSAAGGFNFEIADPCSGLRSLLAMTALTAVYAFFTQKTLIKKWVLFLSAVPLAIAGNIVRIITIAIVAQIFGQTVAISLYHDYSALIVFFVAVVLMVGFGRMLDINTRENLKKWKKELKDAV